MVTATTLSTLLAEERAALGTGDLAALRRITAAKDTALNALRQHPLDPATLSQLRMEAARNDALLAAHAAGLRAALARIDALTKRGDPFASYDNTGAPTSIGPNSPDFERRS